nr:heat shock 70 kDa protein 16-like [Tanacetum cinerariifolium]
VSSHARASIRLRASCEKVKKVLSANTEAPLSIECLIADKDVRGTITKEEFENLSRELLERVMDPCIKAVHDSGISLDKIYTIELVGSGSRIPAIMKRLTSLFQKEPTRTLNASECVARGCALRCAMLSPTLKVQDYKVQDIFPYSIGLPADKSQHEITIFAKGCLFPGYHVLKCNVTTPFHLQVFYANDKNFPAGMSTKVGHFMIDSSYPSRKEQARFEFVVLLNRNGVVEIGSASIIEEYNRSRKNNKPHSENMVANSHMSNLEFSENLDVATTKDELRKAQEIEKMLEEQDKKVEQTKDERNTLESFVYDTRSKLQNAYKRFVTDSENEGITKSLQETEDWLYEDSDDECDEQIYTGKLVGLQKLLEPIENRYKHENKVQAKKPLLAMIEEYRLVADSLPIENKMELENACAEVEQYLSGHSLENYDPIGWSNFIKKTMDKFKRICEAVEKKVQATKPLLAMIEEQRLLSDSLPLENKKEVESIPLLLILTTLYVKMVTPLIPYNQVVRHPKAIL